MKDLEERMTECDCDIDIERAHTAADEVLIEALRRLAVDTPHKKVVRDMINTFNRMAKWYA